MEKMAVIIPISKAKKYSDKLWADYENAVIQLRNVQDAIKALEEVKRDASHLEHKWVYWKARCNRYEWAIDELNKRAG